MPFEPTLGINLLHDHDIPNRYVNVTGDSHVVMAGYVNKAARDAGGQPIDQRAFDYNKSNDPFILSELDKAGVNAVKVAYDTIKAATTTDENGVVTPGEFATAIDA